MLTSPLILQHWLVHILSVPFLETFGRSCDSLTFECLQRHFACLLADMQAGHGESLDWLDA